MKVSELSGAKLDYWAGRATTINPAALRITNDGVCEWRERNGTWRRWAPSIKWQQGGPIIEREGIDLQHVHIGKSEGKDDPDFFWAASMYGQEDDTPDWEDVVSKKVHRGYAKTPLEAAMRCYVASRFGDEANDES